MKTFIFFILCICIMTYTINGMVQQIVFKDEKQLGNEIVMLTGESNGSQFHVKYNKRTEKYSGRIYHDQDMNKWSSSEFDPKQAMEYYQLLRKQQSELLKQQRQQW